MYSLLFFPIAGIFVIGIIEVGTTGITQERKKLGIELHTKRIVGILVVVYLEYTVLLKETT